MKTPKPKLSKSLSKRTKLSPSQLQRVRGQAGEGLASRYDENGNQSLQLTRNLAKAKARAKKYVLCSDQLGKRVYLSNELVDIPLTFNQKEALLFFEGFDNPEDKIAYWNLRVPAIKFKTTHQ